MNINKHIYYLEQLTCKKVILIEDEEDEKETFFTPQDLEGRKEKYIQSIYRLLNQEVIDGDLEIVELPIKDLGRVKEIKGDLELIDLSIKNLGKIKRVTGSVILYECYNLENLGYLDYVGVDFECERNDLKSLIGCPKEIRGDFDCSKNKLINLQGVSKKIGGGFDCSDNNLITLNGAPKKIDGNFDCSHNNLTTLNGVPEIINGNFICYNNIKRFTQKEIRAACYVHGRIINS